MIITKKYVFVHQSCLRWNNCLHDHQTQTDTDVGVSELTIHNIFSCRLGHRVIITTQKSYQQTKGQNLLVT